MGGHGIKMTGTVSDTFTFAGGCAISDIIPRQVIFGEQFSIGVFCQFKRIMLADPGRPLGDPFIIVIIIFEQDDFNRARAQIKASILMGLESKVH